MGNRKSGNERTGNRRDEKYTTDTRYFRRNIHLKPLKIGKYND